MANGTASHIGTRHRGDCKKFIDYQKYFSHHMMEIDNF